MVYKRYIYRNGKRFGPYYYHTYRDKQGKTHSRYVSENKETRAVTEPFKNKPLEKVSNEPFRKRFPKIPPTFKQHKTLFILLGAIFFILIAIFILGNQFSQSEQGASGFSFKNLASNVKSFFTGLTSEEAPSESGSESSSESSSSDSGGGDSSFSESTSTETPEETTTEETPAEEITEAVSEETPDEIGNETQEEPATNETEEPSTNETIIGPEQNVTENETIETPQIPSNESSEGTGTITNATNQTVITNGTIANITEILNETNFIIVQNVTNTTILNETVNITTQENVVQYSAVLGKPVKWEKRIKVDIDGANSAEGLVVDLPNLAGNVSVKKIKDEKEEELDVNVKNEKTIAEESHGITGSVTSETGGGGFFKGIFNFILGFFGRGITGRAVDVSEVGDEVKVEIKELLEDNSEIAIGYYTDAPYSEEQEIDDGKVVKIIGPGDIHYENVLAFTNLNEDLKINYPSKVKIYWEEQSKYLTPLKVEDKNGNGIYDYVEWIVPSLSNQTFRIILITKAEHLDENYTVLSDIYEQVKDLDGIWSETIPGGHYVRATFEHKLDSSRDITLYPRVVNGTPRIEVYEVNQSILIAEFTSLNSEEYNTVYLDGLQGEQDTFDLRVLDGSLEFDHIIDPATVATYYPNQTDQIGYFGLDSQNPVSPVLSGWSSGPTTMNSTNEDEISRSDNTWNSISMVSGINQYNVIMVRFKISESTSTINNLTYTWEGYNEIVNEIASANDLYFYVYNFTAGSWGSSRNTSCLNDACGTSGTERVLTAVISGSSSTLFHYINSSGHTLMLVQELDSFVECPTIYSWNGSEYLLDSVGIPKLNSSEKERLILSEVPNLEIKDGKAKLQLREVLNETSHLDEIFLLVNDNFSSLNITRKIYPSIVELNGEKIELGEIRFSDNNYLLTNHNDTLDLYFENIPGELPLFQRKTSLGVEGYFTLHQENPFHNTLWTDLIKLDVNYNATDNAPQWSLNSTNSTVRGASVQHSVAWSDDTALSGYIFSFDNGNGTLINDSWVSMNGVANWSNVTKTINSTYNILIQWKVFANDSVNQWNSTDTFSYLTTDNAPTHNTPSLSPYPIYLWQNLTCANQSTVDADGDSVTNIYNWLIDGTSITALYLPFDTNSSSAAKDYSGNGFNATINGTPLWTSGKIGGGYHFNESTNDFLVVPNTSLVLGNNFTINFWFNMGRFPQAPFIDAGFFSKGNYSLGVSLNWNAFDGLILPTRINNSYLLMATYPDPGNWYMYSLACDNRNCTLYINGSRENQSLGAPSNLADYNLTIGLGRDSSGAFSPFNGTIDDFRVYNRTLTSQQVYQLFQDTRNGLTNNATLVYQEMINPQNITCQVTPNDAILDGATSINSSVYTDSAPNVNLVSPVSGSSYIAINSLSLQCNVTDDILIKNISLYINTTGTWHLNQTKYSELPNSGIYDSYNNINMTGNTLLYHFNNDAGYGENLSIVYDFSGSGNNGTPVGFDGDEFIEAYAGNGIGISTDDYVNTSNIFTATATGTISTWVNFKNRVDTTTDYAILGNYNGGAFSSGEFLVYLNNDQDLEFLSATGSAQTNYSSYVNSWHHVALTWASNDVVLYIDGSSKATDSSFSDSIFGFSGQYVLIGRDRDAAASPNPNRDFNGTIDDVAFFNRTLNSTEIFNIYNLTRNYYANFSLSGLSDGSYLWNCLAYDNSSKSSFASSNWTFSADMCSITQVSSSTTLTGSQCEHYNISADNVVFDCNSYRIFGNNSYGIWGVNVAARNNVTIKNCRMEQYAKVIHFDGTNNSFIQNNTLYNNSWINTTYVTVYGIALDNSHNTTLNLNNITKLWSNSTDTSTCYSGNLSAIYINNSNNVLVNSSILNDIVGNYYGDTSAAGGCQGGFVQLGNGIILPLGTYSDSVDILNSNISNLAGGYAIRFENTTNSFVNNSRLSYAQSLIAIVAGGNITVYNNQLNYSTDNATFTGAFNMDDRIIFDHNQLHHGVKGMDISGDIPNGINITYNTLSNFSSSYILIGSNNSVIEHNILRDPPVSSNYSGINIDSVSNILTNNDTITGLVGTNVNSVQVSSSSINLSGLNITNCQTAFYLLSVVDNVSIFNSSITNCSSTDITLGAGAVTNIELYNVSFNKSKIDFLSTGFVEVYYQFTGNTTDQVYTAVSSVNFNLTDTYGALLINNNQTDANGLTTTQWIMEYNQTGDATYVTGCTGSSSTINCSTPHNFSAAKSGYGSNFTGVTMNASKMVHLILYTPVILAYVPTTDTFSIAEPSNQTFSITYSNVTPVNIKWFVDSSRQTPYDNQSTFIWVGNYTQAGTYSIKVNISAGNLEDDQIWSMTVNDTNTEPMHNTPSLSPFPGVSSQNLSCYNQSTSDNESDTVTNVYNWLVNSNSMLLLNMPFDVNVSGSVGVRDYSGNANNGSLTGTTWKSSGKVGGALDFDGVDDSVNIASSSSLNSTHNGLTVAFWANPKTPNAGSNYFVYKSNDISTRAEYTIGLSGSRIRVVIFNETGTSSQLLLSNTTIANDSFTFISFTYNGTKVSVYLNGTLDNSTDTSTVLRKYNNPIILGMNPNDLCLSNCYTNMTLDNLQIYNRTLTSQQVYQIYQDTKNGFSNASTIVNGEFAIDQNLTCQVTPNDAKLDGATKQNSTVIANAYSVAMDLSSRLGQMINWSLSSLPAYNQSADGNNGTGITEYWVNITSYGGTSDLYMKAESDLRTAGGDVLGIGNETYSNSTSNSSVPDSIKIPLTTDFSNHLIASNIGNATIYLKFFLNAPARQAAGNYNNSLSFRAVQNGESP